jgi:hypothetical protein
MSTPILHEARPEPRSVRIYLRAHGWQNEAGVPGEPTIWTLPSTQGTFEVIAPSSPQARDFDARIAELLRTISIAENRSPDEVLNDLFALGFDIQYIRSSFDGPPGTAPLRDAVGEYIAAQNMMAAVSASLEEPRPVLPASRSARAREVIRRVRAGPTSAGSYVISIWTPIPPRMTPEEDLVLFEIADEPFERRTTALLHTALRSARSAVSKVLDENADLSTFIDRAPEGVSANLCESLVALSGETRTPFDVRFTWALDRPMQASESAVSFDRPSFEVLSEAAREMRTELPEEDVRIRGNVVRLHREGTRLGAGEITIAGAVSGDSTGRLRKVWVSLSESDYQLAIRAHETGADVDLTGSLIERGTRTYLTLSGDFVVLPDQE